MSGKRELTTRGVVIGRRAASEGSARIFLYTEALGLLSAIARSAREERSQLRPHVQWGTRGLYTLVLGRETWRVTGAADTVNIFFDLSGNTAAKQAAAQALETVRQFVRGERPDPEVFDTLFRFLEALPTLSDSALKEAEVLAVFRMLSALGYVEPDVLLGSFLEPSYDSVLLEAAGKMRPRLVRAVNDGISASGL